MSQPRQEIYLDDRGVARFRANRVVEWLLETKRINLNEIAVVAIEKDFPVEDLMQFWQMIGYSVGGFEELHFVEDKKYIDRCWRRVDELVAKVDVIDAKRE